MHDAEKYQSALTSLEEKLDFLSDFTALSFVSKVQFEEIRAVFEGGLRDLDSILELS